MKLNKILFVLITSLVLLSDLLPAAHNMYAKANGNAIYSVSMHSDYEDIDYTHKWPLSSKVIMIINPPFQELHFWCVVLIFFKNISHFTHCHILRRYIAALAIIPYHTI